MSIVERFGERVGLRALMKIGVGLGVVGALLLLGWSSGRRWLMGVGDDDPPWNPGAMQSYRAADGQWETAFPGKPTVGEERSPEGLKHFVELRGEDDAVFRVAWIEGPSDVALPAADDTLGRYCEDRIYAARVSTARRAGAVTGRTFQQWAGNTVRCRSELTTEFKRADGKTAQGRGLLYIVRTPTRRYEVSMILSSQLAGRIELNSFVDSFKLAWE